MNTYYVYTAGMSPALSRSSELERFECSNAIKIRNKIMFDFYPGLPHTILLCISETTPTSYHAKLPVM